MGRRFLLWLAAGGLAVCAVGQDLPEGATELDLQEMSGEKSPAEADESGDEEAVLDSRIAFLGDTAIQYEDEGEYEEAERTYLRILEADPDNEEIRFRLSTLYVMTGQYTNAVPLLEELATTDPENASVHNNLAWIYATGIGTINREKALWHAREALVLTPLSPDAWNTLAEAYYVSGGFDKALQASAHAIDLLWTMDSKSKSMPLFEAQRNKILRAKDAAELLKSFGFDQ
jgi:tetratricopeptide (TPR) repeat protein